MAKLVAACGFEHLWVDNLCINQSCSNEITREVNNMGNYYKMSKMCIVFPGGVGCIGHIINDDYSCPRWYSRVWTLQEMILSKNKVYVYKLKYRYVFEYEKSIGPITVINIDDYKIVSRRACNILWKNRYVYMILQENQVGKAAVLAVAQVNNNIHKRETISYQTYQDLSKMSNSWQTTSWTLLNVLRAIPHRNCSNLKPEDRIYGTIGLIGIQGIHVEYGIGLRNAIVKLANEVDDKTRLLLTIVEWYSIDGSVLPQLTEHALPARGIDVADCTGKASVSYDGNVQIETLFAYAESIIKDFDVGSLLTGNEGQPRDKADWFDVTISGNTYNAYGRLDCDIVGPCRVSLIGKTAQLWDHQLLKINNIDVRNLVISIVTASAENTGKKIGILAIDNTQIAWKTGCFVVQ